MYIRIGILFFLVFILACKDQNKSQPTFKTKDQKEDISSMKEEHKLTQKKTNPSIKIQLDYDTIEWSELTVADSLLIDLKYATSDNFTKTQVYDCARCFLRPEVAARIRRINFHLKRTHGWRLKLFDCYRPRPYQQRLWDIVPDPIYVSDPKKGSMHNRGAAVDLTIVDTHGKPLDMGTEFDYFGRKAHSDFQGLPDTVLANRQFLEDIMVANGFKGIQSEWWHYSISGLGSQLSEWIWDCKQ